MTFCVVEFSYLGLCNVLCTEGLRSPSRLHWTSLGEDKLGARHRILNTKVARRACAGRAPGKHSPCRGPLSIQSFLRAAVGLPSTASPLLPAIDSSPSHEGLNWRIRRLRQVEVPPRLHAQSLASVAKTDTLSPNQAAPPSNYILNKSSNAAADLLSTPLWCIRWCIVLSVCCASLYCNLFDWAFPGHLWESRSS